MAPRVGGCILLGPLKGNSTTTRTRASSVISCPPLLKWPGGKRALLKELLALSPRFDGRYFEPFLGGGALFFALQPEKALLSDTNRELIECYEHVRDDPRDVLRRLRAMPNTKSEYLRVRASKPTSPAGRAARFIYLTTLSFNGIYRVNLAGQFNVPYGWKKHLDVAQEDRLEAVSKALKGRRLLAADFAVAVESAKDGDFVYLDPPYTVAHENNGFLKYNAKVFSWTDQKRLAAVALDLAKRGCSVIVTNACHQSIRSLYAGMTQIVVSRPSRIAASAEHRGSVNELIITNIGL